MIKFMFKLLVIWLALQSALGYLREQEIIYGSIEINYPVLQKKALEIIPTEEISEALIHLITKKLKESLTPETEQQNRFYRTNEVTNRKSFKEIVHVVHQGDTLTELSEQYGISWKVIKKINRIENKDQLLVGQRLRIPSRLNNLT